VVNCLITNNYYGPDANEIDIASTALAGNTANLIGRVGSSGDINYASGVAADYTANVSIDGNSYTVSVPALQAKKDTEYAKYVPVSAGGSAASGGVYATYFDYSNLSAIKMGYKVNENDAITALGNLTAPDAESAESNKVTTYFEGTARAAGVIGASGVGRPSLVGDSIYRTAAGTANVKFVSDSAGTYYYQVTDSDVAPSADAIKAATTGVHGSGSVTAGTTATLPLTDLTAGAQYVYAVVESDDGRMSDVLTLSMPYNIFYYEGFEAYAEDETVSDGGMAPLSNKNAGSGASEQKVTAKVSGSGQMLQLAASGTASDQIVDISEMITDEVLSKGRFVLEGDIYPTFNSGEKWQRLTFTDGTYDNEAGVMLYQGAILNGDETNDHLSDSFTANRWYHVKIELYPEAKKYNVTIDGVELADCTDIDYKGSTVKWLAFSTGESAAGYYDNLKFYVDLSSTVTITPGEHMTRTAASGDEVQTVPDGGSYADVVYEAEEGYYFPEDYEDTVTATADGGISVTRESYTQITVSGTPATAKIDITLPDPAAKVQAATPQAIFNATGSDTGTLSGVSAGMTYQINDGTVHSISAEDISDSGVEITGVSAGTIKVVQPETDTTLASDEQTIEVGKAETPDLMVKRPTVIGGKGGVTDSTNAHEYMYSADGETWTEWTACKGEMSGLDEGQYRIRVKASGNILASEYQEFTITAFVPDQETKPEGVSFTADGSDTGILSGLTPGEKYGVSGAGLDSAADSTKTADENGKITLTGLAAGTLSVVKKGNGTTTIDSDPFEITVDKAETPEGLGKTDCTTADDNDGTITGATVAMEYRKSGGESDSDTWTDVPADGSMTDLAPGTYYVRVKAVGATLASESVTLEIAAYIPPPTYQVNVVDGTFDGEDHEAGETVTVTANSAPEGFEFDKWTSGDGVSFADEYAAVTTFIMPARDVTVTATYKKIKMLPVVTLPTAKSGLTYTGSAKALINAGSADGGTMKYAVTVSGAAAPAAGEYTETVPEKTNAGNYTVYYRVDSDSEHLESDAEGSIEVSIAKAAHADAQIPGGARFGLSGILQLSEFIEAGATLGSISISDESGVLNATPALNGTVLGFEMKNLPENVGKSAIVTIPVKDMTNIADYELKITLTVAECEHEHTEIRNLKAAVCNEKGYTGDTWCTDCNRKIAAGEETPIDANNHAYDEGVITKQPSVITKGIKLYTCTRCGHTYTETLPVLEDEEDHSDLIEDITDDLGETGADAQTETKEDGSTETTITVGDQEISKTVTDTNGDTTVETKVWIGGLKSSYAYTGAAIKPDFHVYDGIRKLTAGTDYSVKYANNKNANSTAVITVTFKGNYKATPAEQIEFSIKPAELGTDVLARNLAVVATGRAQKPVPVLVWAGTDKEINKKNFNFSYRRAGDEEGAALESVKDAGEYIVTVTPKNSSFSESTTAVITVTDDKKLMLSNASVTMTQKSYTYTGQKIIPEEGSYTLSLNKQSLTEGEDYEVSEIRNNINPGKATIVFTAINGNANGYVGSKSVTFTIKKGRELKEGEGFEYIYDKTVPYAKGGAKPAVKVTDGGLPLTAGTDYTVSYSQNKAVTSGETAVITVKGRGNYRGSVKLMFAIEQQNIEALAGNIIVSDKLESKKGYRKPSVTVTDLDGKVLKNGRDFELDTDYTEPDEDGRVTVSLKGKGNYSGKTGISYRYIKASAQLGKVKAKKLAAKTYTGYSVQLSNADLTQILYTGSKSKPEYLVPGVDFEVMSYSNNTKKGTATVTLRGIGAYGGTKTITFKITNKKGDYKGALVDGVWK